MSADRGITLPSPAPTTVAPWSFESVNTNATIATNGRTVYSYSGIAAFTTTLSGGPATGVDEILLKGAANAGDLTVNLAGGTFTDGDDTGLVSIMVKAGETVRLLRLTATNYLVCNRYPSGGESLPSIVHQMQAWELSHTDTPEVESVVTNGYPAARLGDAATNRTHHYLLQDNLSLTVDSYVKLRLAQNTAAVATYCLRQAGAPGNNSLIVNKVTGDAVSTGTRVTVLSSRVSGGVIEVYARWQAHPNYREWVQFPALGNTGTTGSAAALIESADVIEIDLNADPPRADTATVGDVKSGLQAADHNGWYLCDGRAFNTLGLSADTLADALALAVGPNLPDATGAVAMQNGTPLGSSSGVNTRTLSQVHLPNITLTGTTDASGDHVHSQQRAQQINANTRQVGGGAFRNRGNINVDTGAAGDHTHVVTVPLGGSGQSFDITPRSMSVNVFLYLGV